MKAKFENPQENARNLSGAKETISTYNVIACREGEPRELITVRCYMGRSNQASTVYASIWVHGEKYCSGHGSAGGYGYHKESQAIEEAIHSAGITLWGSPCLNRGKTEDLKKRAYIGSVGEAAVDSALQAIARAMGYRGKLLIVKN